MSASRQLYARAHGQTDRRGVVVAQLHVAIAGETRTTGK